MNDMAKRILGVIIGIYLAPVFAIVSQIDTSPHFSRRKALCEAADEWWFMFMKGNAFK